MLCEYGCGQEAKFYFPTVNKWCCQNHVSKCPSRIKSFSGKNNPMYKKTPWNKGKTDIYSEETLRKIRSPRKTKGKTYEEIYGLEVAAKLKKERSKRFKEIKKGTIPWNKGKTGIFSDETLEKMRKNSRYNLDDYKEKYPMFIKIEKPKIRNDKIEVRCKECKIWFVPTKIQLYERLRRLKDPPTGHGNSYFFCSEECKNKSEYYWRQKDPNQLEEFQSYNSLVYKYTRQTVNNFSHKITNLKLRGNKYNHELDHKYSIYEGFLNNIDPKIISHYKNLQVIPTKENRKKKFNSSISLKELLEITS